MIKIGDKFRWKRNKFHCNIAIVLNVSENYITYTYIKNIEIINKNKKYNYFMINEDNKLKLEI